MFSLNYTMKMLRLLVEHPVALTSKVIGGNSAFVIDQQRRAKWQIVGTRYALRPKRTSWFSIYLNPKDRSNVSSSIGSFGWFNLALTELFRKTVKNGMTVIDVGANIGYYTLLASTLVGENGTVFAFEPEPECFRLMVKSIETNRFHNVIAQQSALSAQEGNTYIHLSTDPTGQIAGNSVRNDPTRNQGKLSILTPCMTLDSLRHIERIDLVKIHTSGSETSVLHGGQKLIDEHHPRIIVPIVPDLWIWEEDLLEYLKSSYDVFEVVQSPLLIRRITNKKVLGRDAMELYLTPKSEP